MADVDLNHTAPAPMYARWEDVERAVREAVESELTDHDPTEGPLPRWEIEWAQGTARRVAQAVMQQLDGHAPDDIRKGADRG